MKKSLIFYLISKKSESILELHKFLKNRRFTKDFKNTLTPLCPGGSHIGGFSRVCSVELYFQLQLGVIRGLRSQMVRIKLLVVQFVTETDLHVIGSCNKGLQLVSQNKKKIQVGHRILNSMLSLIQNQQRVECNSQIFSFSFLIKNPKFNVTYHDLVIFQSNNFCS